MKRLHLIANAHVDPVWQWDWQEGAAVALSTFRSAVEIAKEYDYIFCHNEVLLYEYIEEYAPSLFEEIKELVKAGKWHIMGGWYLQPDCNMPSGESFIRQIMAGRKYFEEKFGIFPSVAVNFDPFGHTRGLVQILKKSGQDSYLITRPHSDQCLIDDDCFKWVGFDGSEVNVARCFSYRTPLGGAVNSIKETIKENENRDVWFSLWGVGNHGGGPSRKDLSDIAELQSEKDLEILHSTPKAFFDELQPTVRYDKSLQHCNPGCYVSMAQLKKHHIKLENELYATEKISSIAALNGLMEYPEKELLEAERDLLESEFHDVLPGTSVKTGEENGLRVLQHGEHICEKLYARAFFALTLGQDKAKDGEYPIFVFNPHPHKVKTVVECEFTLADQNFTEKQSCISVYDGEKLLTSQIIKEASHLNCDWRKRIVFLAELEPMKAKRFSVYVDFKEVPEKKILDGGVTVTTKDMQVTIGDNGLMTSYKIDGKEYLSAPAFAPYVYDDNVDPWAMDDKQLKELGENPTPIPLIEKSEGIFKSTGKVSVLEDGDVLTAVQACFECKEAKLRLIYRIYKQGYDVDVRADVFFNSADKMIKLHVPTTFTNGNYRGQTAFGTDELYADGREIVAHRFVSVCENAEERLAILNNCIYGSSFKDGTIKLSLVRGAGYCVHPMPDKPFFSDYMYVERIDQGERNFDFKLTFAREDALENMAAEFNQKPFALNIFPCEKAKEDKGVSVFVENPCISLSALKKEYHGEKYVVRLFNNSSTVVNTSVSIGKVSMPLSFGKFEVKTLLYDGKEITEAKELAY